MSLLKVFRMFKGFEAFKLFVIVFDTFLKDVLNKQTLLKKPLSESGFR